MISRLTLSKNFGELGAYHVDLPLAGELAWRQGTSDPMLATPSTAGVFQPVGDTTLEEWRLLSPLGDVRDKIIVGQIPITDFMIGKLASGVADNLLTSAYLSCQAPVVIAPAMNVRMWEHPATKRNVAQLKADGVSFVEIDRDTGKLATPMCPRTFREAFVQGTEPLDQGARGQRDYKLYVPPNDPDTAATPYGNPARSEMLRYLPAGAACAVPPAPRAMLPVPLDIEVD